MSSATKGPAAKFDAEDCRNPVCGSKMQMFSASLARAKQEAPKVETAVECPLDRDELGRSTWNLLHTTAAYYPEKPEASDQQLAGALIRGLAAQCVPLTCFVLVFVFSFRLSSVLPRSRD